MVSEFITRTAKLVPYAKRPKQVPSFVTAYSYEPLPDDPGAKLGSLFAVIEVLVSGRSSEEVADLVIETIGQYYYNTATQTDPLTRFESAIKAANHELAEYVNQGKAAWIGKLSAVVAIQIENQLHIAQTGSAEAFLYRGRSSSRITNRQPTNRPATPTKTFGSIMSGELEIGDRLLIAAPALIHQLSLQQLREVIANNTPNNAISEITQLLRAGSGERIAALVIEITTPELAALQVRSEQPDEIQIGLPETPMEAARIATAPIAQATVTSGRRLGAATSNTWQKLQPRLQHAGLQVARLLRHELGHPAGRWRLGAIAGLIVIGTAGYVIWQNSNQATQHLFTRYQTAYQQFVLAGQTLQAGDKSTARTILDGVKSEVADLSKNGGDKRLDYRLKHSALPESEPNTIAGFSQAVSAKIDELDGLRRIAANTIAQVPAIKTPPTHLELVSNKAYLIGNSAIQIVDLSTKAVQTSKAVLPANSTVISTTLSANNDGLYLLTNKPAVFFYRFDTDTLNEQTITLGQWPTGATSIGSYAGNLYILAQGTIYKHVRTATGFAPKTEYLSSRTASGIKDAQLLAVDGSVYTLSPTNLQRYLAGSLQVTAANPSGISAWSALHSTDSGNSIIAVASASQRIAFWDARQGLALKDQYIINDVKNVYDAAYSPKDKLVYALVNDRLVSFTP